MNWDSFIIYALSAIVFWSLSLILHMIPSKNKILPLIANIMIIVGLAILAIYISLLWIDLDRPPLRTLGETRLWYSFFLPFIGLITYSRWKYKWFLGYSIGLSILFLVINFMHPENFSKTLMPALQSPWFVPHVIVYIFSYALLAASSIVAIKGLYETYFREFKPETLDLADNLVYVGYAFLTLGLAFGALWAKEAWGHYWTWDPKETWALLTFLCYLVYMHFRYLHKSKVKTQLWILGLAFIVLLIAWFGINYLPSAQNSVHTYGQS